MRLRFSKKTSSKVIARLKNRVRIRRKIEGSAERPRLSVFRSGRHVYAQIIDDVNGKTLAATSSLKVGGSCNRETAKKVGQEIARLAGEKSLKDVVFDRSGYVYHGRVQALAEGAREGGLNF